MAIDQPNLQTHDWPILLTGQTLLFGLLGRILYSYPEEAWLLPLVEDQVFSEAPFAGHQPDVAEGLTLLSGWASAWNGGAQKESLEAIKSDNMRVLSGVGGLPVVPWESVYFNDNRLLFQEQTLDVRAWYLRFGLQPEKMYKEPDDHIGLELSFMAHLASLALQAVEQQDEAGFRRFLEAERGFLDKHLLLWGPLWCNLMLKHARTDFYRGVALLVRGALKEMANLHGLAYREAQVE